MAEIGPPGMGPDGELAERLRTIAAYSVIKRREDTATELRALAYELDPHPVLEVHCCTCTGCRAAGEPRRSAADRLAEVRACANAATPGPWLLAENQRLTHRVEHESREVIRQQARLDAVRALCLEADAQVAVGASHVATDAVLRALDGEPTKDGA